jgi:hypothetical protein
MTKENTVSRSGRYKFVSNNAEAFECSDFIRAHGVWVL